MKYPLIRKWILAVFVICLSLSASAAAYSSGTFGSSTFSSCTFGSVCTISVTSNGSVSINITPTVSGSCTVNSDNVSVLTDDTNGYTLTLSDTTTNNSLVNGASSIPATTGSYATPAALTTSYWGYRVVGQGNFGSTATSSQSNVLPSSISGQTFALLEPSSSVADTIAATSAAADPAVSTTVWYGACAGTSVASGSYSTTALYTAISN